MGLNKVFGENWRFAIKNIPKTQNLSITNFLCVATSRFRILTCNATDAHLPPTLQPRYTDILGGIVSRTTGKRAPQMRINENERINPILEEIFS
jgi:hypothetical protein